VKHQGYNCRLDHVDCAAEGLGHQVAGGPSCHKIIDRTSLRPRAMGCGDGEKYDAGLCYSPCENSDFRGIGPVCWQRTPAGWVSCGAGIAESDEACREVMTNQFISVISLGLVVAETAVAPQGVTDGLTRMRDSIEDNAEEFQRMWRSLKGKPVWAKLTSPDCSWQAGGREVNFGNVDGKWEEANRANAVDRVRLFGEMLEMFDPTGISSVVSAFSWSICEHSSDMTQAATSCQLTDAELAEINSIR